MMATKRKNRDKKPNAGRGTKRAARPVASPAVSSQRFKSRTLSLMGKPNLLDGLTELLEAEQRFISNGEILKNVVIEAALKMDPCLLELLMQSDALKEHFFTKVAGTLIFDKVKFQNFVSNKAFLPDSYTAFKNRIGLTDGRGDFLSQSRDVVLAWPYKDCVLEGGMTKEDRSRDEVFWNTTLASDDITRLFEPKVLVGWERWDAKAVAKGKPKPVGEVAEDDNLLIKGNNLLALHSLKKRYAGKVNLIYIDPPYNTGNDGFKYNDQFNHSSWLTFMRNRLEVAKELLSRDGAIFINLDDGELHYCKVLMDEIFGSECFVFQASIMRGAPTGHKAINPTPVQVADYVLTYCKDPKIFSYIPQYVERAYDKAYSKYIENYDDGIDSWEFINLVDVLNRNDITVEEAIKSFPERIIRFAQPNYDGVGEETRKLINKSKKSPNRIFVQKRDNNPDVYLMNGNRILFYCDKMRNIDGNYVTSELMTNFWTDIAFQGIANEGGVTLRKGKKPEKLLRRILQVCTKPNDIVLDFCVGSGTTAAVAHKMGRRWIAIEQMDYIEDLTATRLKKVIEGEQGGISKAVEWQGGGSFVYTELAASNSTYVDRIEAATNNKTLQAVYAEIQTTGYLRYEVDLSAFDEGDFAALPLEDAKRVLMDCLDANHLYVNLNSLGDTAFKISKGDVAATRSFYGVTE